jgi:hypothetical protein
LERFYGDERFIKVDLLLLFFYNISYNSFFFFPSTSLLEESNPILISSSTGQCVLASRLVLSVIVKIR